MLILAILSSVLASLLFALSAISVKPILSDWHQILWIGLIRCLMQLTIIVPVMVFQKTRVFGTRSERHYLFACAVLDSGYQTCYFLSMYFIKAMDAAAICYSYPVFVSLISHFFNGQKFQKRYIVSALIGVVGALIICKPNLDFQSEARKTNKHYAGYILAAMAGFCMAFLSIFCGRLKETSSLATAFFTSVLPLVVYMASLLLTNSYRDMPPCGMQSILNVASGILFEGGTIFYFLSYKHADAKLLTVVGILETPIVLLFDRYILGTAFNWHSLIGVATLLLSIILTLLFTSNLKDNLENFMFYFAKIRNHCNSYALKSKYENVEGNNMALLNVVRMMEK